MKTNKEKTQPEKELDRLKSKPLSDDLRKVIEKKERDIKRDVKK